MPDYDAHMRPFRYYTQFILPLSYDDALSYYEVLAKVTTKLNEVIEWANNYKDELYAYVDQKTQENLTIMRQELATYKETVDASLADMQDQLDNILTRVDQIIADFEAKLDKFQQDITAQFDQFKKEITEQIEQNEAWVKSEILRLEAKVNAQLQIVYMQMQQNKEFNKMYTDAKIEWLIQHLQDVLPTPVISPITGKLSPIQKVLYEIVDACRVWAVTCGQYDLLGLTCEEYDNLQLTCYKYDWFAWYYLGPYRYIHRAFSEITGQFVPVQQCIYELYALHRNGLTAGEYDAKELTAEEYDNLNLSAYAYDWTGIPAT